MFTADNDRGLGVARQVRTGTYMLNSNVPIDFGNPFGGMGAAQIIFGTTIPKTGTQVMTLTFRQTWARYP